MYISNVIGKIADKLVSKSNLNRQKYFFFPIMSAMLIRFFQTRLEKLVSQYHCHVTQTETRDNDTVPQLVGVLVT